MARYHAARRSIVHDTEEMQACHAQTDSSLALQGLETPLMLT